MIIKFSIPAQTLIGLKNSLNTFKTSNTNERPYGGLLYYQKLVLGTYQGRHNIIQLLGNELPK